MNYKISNILHFIAVIFTVGCFSAGAYAGFTGKGGWGFFEGTLFLLTALLFIFAGIFFRKKSNGSVNSTSHKDKTEYLKINGQKIVTQFKALDRKWNTQINGRSPIVIYSQDSNGQVFQSEDLWFSGEDSSSYDDPRFQAWQKLQAIEPTKKYLIPVYRNPDKISEYYMDLGGLQIEQI